jgi:methionyl-tRNA synthetase
VRDAEIARANYDAREFGKVLRDAMRIADHINEAFDAAQPWLLAKDPAQRDRLQTACSQALQGFALLSVILAPVLPASRRASPASCSGSTVTSSGPMPASRRRGSMPTGTC